MLAAVIPAKRMPSSLEFLDYAIPEELIANIKIGQLVNIPLRGRMEYGVIYKISASDQTSSKIKIQPLKAIVALKPLLCPAQLEWLKEMAEFYKTPLGFLLKMNLPPLQKNKLKIIAALTPNPTQTSWPNKKFIQPKLLIKDKKSANEWLIKNISPIGQTLILVPELANIKVTLSALSKEQKKQALIYTSDLSVKEARMAWLQIWQTQKRIVVGTRTALFLPWTDLAQVIIMNEGNFDYKSWDMAPRFQTRDACLFLTRQHNSALVFIDDTPSVDSWFFATRKIYRLEGQIKTTNNQISIINLRDEKKFGNYGSITIDLRDKISTTAQDIFLLAGRAGSFAYTFCRDCAEAIVCPRCKKPLAYTNTIAKMHCRACHLEKPLPMSCPHCHSPHLRSLGAGTEEIANELKKIFPERKIIKIDGADKTDLKSLKSNQQKIIVATTAALPHIIWPTIGLAAILDADMWFAIPEFKSLEKIWVTWRRLLLSLNKNSELFIQTTKPEREFFAYLNHPQRFYAAELTQRKSLNYPPYSFLLKIFYGHNDEKKTVWEANQIYRLLCNLTTDKINANIIGPLPMNAANRKNQFWQVIIAKIPYAVYKKTTKLISAALPADWKTDPNPNNLLTL